MEQSQPQINIGRDWNQAPWGSIKIDNRKESKDQHWFKKMLANKFLWLIGSLLIAAVIHYFGWQNMGGN